MEDTLQPPVLPIVEISADEPSADPGPQIEATGEFGAVMDLIHMASNRADLLSSSLDEIKCALSAYDAARLALVASKSALAQLNGKIGHLLSKEIDAITVGHLGSDEDQNTAHVNRKQLSSRVQGMYSATYTIMENIDARLMGTMHRGNVIASNSRGAPRSYHASPDPHQPQSLHVAIPENLRSAEPVPELASQSREMTASQRTLAVPVPEPVPEPIPVPEVPPTGLEVEAELEPEVCVPPAEDEMGFFASSATTTGLQGASPPVAPPRIPKRNKRKGRPPPPIPS